MTSGSPDFSALLECLSGRLPRFRQALLSYPATGLEQVNLAAGELLLQRGAPASALYVVAAGLLRATALREDGSELILSEFGPGEMAGEMAILAGGGVYSASVSAAQDAVLVKVPRESFDRIASAAPEAVHELAEGIRRRLARDQLAVGLTRLFGTLHESVLRFVESRVDWVRLQAGDILFSAGDTGQDLYFVLGGRLRAVADDGRVLNEMSRGDTFCQNFLSSRVFS